ELLRLIGASDVVHFVGPVDGRPAPDGSVLWWWEREPLDLGAIALLPTPPRLLVSHDDRPRGGAGASANRALAAGGCRWGLNVLACEQAGTGAAEPFMLQLYAALVRGAPAAE